MVARGALERRQAESDARRGGAERNPGDAWSGNRRSHRIESGDSLVSKVTSGCEVQPLYGVADKPTRLQTKASWNDAGKIS